MKSRLIEQKIRLISFIKLINEHGLPFEINHSKGFNVEPGRYEHV